MKRLLLGLCTLGLFLCDSPASAQNRMFPRMRRAERTYSTPTYTVRETTTTVSGYMPYTGDSTGAVVSDSSFNQWRTQGTPSNKVRYDNSPLYDRSGNVIGWRTGEGWVDSATGRQYFEGQLVLAGPTSNTNPTLQPSNMTTDSSPRYTSGNTRRQGRLMARMNSRR